MKEGYKFIIILISRVLAHTEQQIIQFRFEHEHDPIATALQPQRSVRGIRTPPISHVAGQLRQVVVVVMRGTRKQSIHDCYRNSKRLHSCIAAS